MPLNRGFPSGGYVRDLDVYLDPAWPDGTGFGYVISYQDLAYPIPLSLRYLQVTGGTLAVAGQEVSPSGWYTFRHRLYSDDDGRLCLVLLHQ
jgi:hypothetical protein